MNPPSTPRLQIIIRDLHPHSSQKNGVIDVEIKETTTIGELKQILSHPHAIDGKYIINRSRWKYDDNMTLGECGISADVIDQWGHNAVFVHRSADLTPIGFVKITDEDENQTREGKDSDSISSSDNDDDDRPPVDPTQRRTITRDMADSILTKLTSQTKVTNTVVDVMEEVKTQQPSPLLPPSVSVLAHTTALEVPSVSIPVSLKMEQPAPLAALPAPASSVVTVKTDTTMPPAKKKRVHPPLSPESKRNKTRYDDGIHNHRLVNPTIHGIDVHHNDRKNDTIRALKNKAANNKKVEMSKFDGVSIKSIVEAGHAVDILAIVGVYIKEQPTTNAQLMKLEEILMTPPQFASFEAPIPAALLKHVKLDSLNFSSPTQLNDAYATEFTSRQLTGIIAPTLTRDRKLVIFKDVIRAMIKKYPKIQN